MRTAPYFFDAFPRSKRPDYPRFRGQLRTDVAIVGGGLTGCACAAAFASAGVDVVLLEAERIGAAGTAGSLGLIRQDLDASFQDTVALHGASAARHVWQGFRRAALDFNSALKRLAIRADVVPQDMLFFTRDGAETTRALQREYQARRAAGVDASWVTPRVMESETHLVSSGGIRTRGEAIDPYRAAIGLAAAAAVKGARIHERSAAVRIRAGRRSVEVTTGAGSLTAEAVVIATGTLPDDLRALRRHFAPRLSYAVVTEPLPAAVRKETGRRSAALRDRATPPHFLRWMKDDRVLFSGGDVAVPAARARARALVPNVQELMYELTTIYPAISGLRPEWGWDAVHYGSPDGLPVIGPHRNFPRHLFALGLGRHGAAGAWLSARVLTRAYLEEPAKGDDLYGFPRIL